MITCCKVFCKSSGKHDRTGTDPTRTAPGVDLAPAKQYFEELVKYNVCINRDIVEFVDTEIAEIADSKLA